MLINVTSVIRREIPNVDRQPHLTQRGLLDLAAKISRRPLSLFIRGERTGRNNAFGTAPHYPFNTFAKFTSIPAVAPQMYRPSCGST